MKFKVLGPTGLEFKGIADGPYMVEEDGIASRTYICNARGVRLMECLWNTDIEGHTAHRLAAWIVQMANHQTIFQGEGGWYWRDETGDEHGPYEHPTYARAELYAYVHYLETGEVILKKDR